MSSSELWGVEPNHPSFDREHAQTGPGPFIDPRKPPACQPEKHLKRKLSQEPAIRTDIRLSDSLERDSS